MAVKFFVILLVVGLISSEKLSRTYLPPPGAIYAGGNSDDLLTPLEFPKETPIYSKNYQTSLERDLENGNFSYYTDDNTRDDTPISTLPDQYLSYLRGGYDNPLLNVEPNVKDSGHMAIIAAQNIGENYQPNLFGIYGGSPMMIKIDNGKEYRNDDSVTSDNIHFSDSSLTFSHENKSYLPIKQTNSYLPTPETKFPNEAIKTKSQNNEQKKYYRKSPQAKEDRIATVITEERDQSPEGYSYNFQTTNGIQKGESASTLNGVKAQGFFSYKGDDGVDYKMTYTADENGFQPIGNHLPTPHPIPEAIQRVIDQVKINEGRGIFDDGSYDDNKYGHMKYQGPIERYLAKMSQNNIKVEGRINDKSKNQLNMRRKYNRNKNNNLVGMRNVHVYKTEPTPELRGKYKQGENIIKSFKNVKENNKFLKVKKVSLRKYNQNPENSLNHENKIVTNTFNKPLLNNSGKIHSRISKKPVDNSFEEGYFYIPPTNIFIDGQYQDSSHGDGKILHQTKITSNLNSKNIPITENYGRTEENQGSISLLITSSEKPLNHETYHSNFHVNSNPYFEDIKNYPTNELSALKTTETDQSRGNVSIVRTNPYNEDFVYNTEGLEYTELPELKTETISNESDFKTTNLLPTSPMPSKMINDIYTDGDIYTSSELSETFSNSEVNYSVNEDYFKTTTELPSTLISSTYNPIYTVDDFNINLYTIVNEDEFEKEHHESLKYTNLPDRMHNSTKTSEFEEPKASLTFDTYENILQENNSGTSSGDMSVTVYPVDDNITIAHDIIGGNDEELSLDNSENKQNKVIGEDFSGPKQPQRFDEINGYYY